MKGLGWGVMVLQHAYFVSDNLQLSSLTGCRENHERYGLRGIRDLSQTPYSSPVGLNDYNHLDRPGLCCIGFSLQGCNSRLLVKIYGPCRQCNLKPWSWGYQHRQGTTI
jgi:hypothetical protein